MNLCLVAWMADTNPHASELIADVRFGRTQAVMPCSPAAALDLHLIGGKVQLVMKDSDVLRAQLVEAHGLSDGAATFIHEYRRFQQQNFFRAKRSEEHTSEIQSLIRISYAVFLFQKKQ